MVRIPRSLNPDAATYSDLLEVLFEAHKEICDLNRTEKRDSVRKRRSDLLVKLTEQAVVITVIRSRISRNFSAKTKERAGRE